MTQFYPKGVDKCPVCGGPKFECAVVCGHACNIELTRRRTENAILTTYY